MKMLFIICAILNAISFFLMRLDKYFACRKKYRIPERTLLFFNFFGPFGAIMSMCFHFKLGRHKNKKSLFWLVDILGTAVFVLVCTYVARL